MKFLKILFFASFFLICQGFSQITFGMLAGGNLDTFAEGVTRDFADSHGGTGSGTLGATAAFGYEFGGIVRYNNDDWALEADLIYADRTMKWGGGITMPTDPSFNNDLQIELKQLEVPLMGYYKIQSESIDYKLGLGINITYGIGNIQLTDSYSKVPSNVIPATGSYDWNTFGFNRINFGGIIGFGTDFHLGASSVVGVELRAATQFSNMKTDLNPNFSGTNVTITNVDLLVNYVF